MDSTHGARYSQRMPGRFRIQTHVRSPHKNLMQLVKDGMDQIVLQPESFVARKELKALNHHYYPNPDDIPTTLERDTVLWYPDRTVAGVFLKKRISQKAQDEALTGFRELLWAPPKRPETKTAIERQKGM
jgi:hypothetical protein